MTDFARIPPPRKLVPRPVEMLEPPREPGFGVPCPDAGYGFLLGHKLDRELVADPMENREDAHWAVATLAVRRAGRAGRAPGSTTSVGRALLGYDGTAPPDLVRWRVLQLRGIFREPNSASGWATSPSRGLVSRMCPHATSLARWWSRLANQAPGHPTPAGRPDRDEEPHGGR